MAEFMRAAWGALPPKGPIAAIRAVPFGALHHIGGGDPYPSDVPATLRQIQAMEQHGPYIDIAYNWGVDQDGNQWELRGDVSDGATLGYAGRSFSVLAICNSAAPNFVVSAAMVAGIAACFRNAQQRGVLAPDAYLDGHHWFDTHETSAPTECPGVPLMGQIPTIRNLVAGGLPPVPQPVRTLKGRKMMIPSSHWVPTGPFDGVNVDETAQTITIVGAGTCDPNPSVIGGKPWAGVAYDPTPQADGFRYFTVVTTDRDPYTFHVK